MNYFINFGVVSTTTTVLFGNDVDLSEVSFNGEFSMSAVSVRAPVLSCLCYHYCVGLASYLASFGGSLPPRVEANLPAFFAVSDLFHLLFQDIDFSLLDVGAVLTGCFTDQHSTRSNLEVSGCCTGSVTFYVSLSVVD